MKKEYGAKLLAYSGMAVAYLTVPQAKAQVYYNDFTPDESVGADLPQDEIYLDLNEDGIDDVRIFGVNGGGSLAGYSAILAEGLNPAGINGCFIATSYVSSISDYAGAAGLASSEVVDSSLDFASGTGTVFRQNWNALGSDSTGVWTPGMNAALGVRLDIAGNSHFGWIKCTLVGAGQIVIRDYMLNVETNTALAVAEPPPPLCEQPSGLSATVLSPTQVQLDWNPVPNVEKYQLKGRTPGAVFITKTNSTNSMVVGVASSSTYEWKVRARCDGGESTGFSPASYFATPPSRPSSSPLMRNENPGEPTASTAAASAALSKAESQAKSQAKSHAPASQYLSSDGKAAITDVVIYTEGNLLSINALGLEVEQVKLYNLSGQVVFADISTFQFKDFDLNHLPAGLYVLQVNRGNNHLTHKLYVE